MIDIDYTVIYVFEYNETEGVFNLNLGDKKENTSGYKTIAKGMYYMWSPFIKWLKKRYVFENENKPSYELIKKEWVDYIKLRKDIELSNKFKIKYARA